MDRGERINEIKKMASRLEDESVVDAQLTLRTFEFATPDFDPEYEEWYAYLVEELEKGSDTQLVELHRHLFPDEAESAPIDDAAGPWTAGTFHLFVSHTTVYRASAGRLSTTLRPWGVHAFVAHDSIEPTREWEEVIEIALATSDAMCVLVTPDLIESRWCDQETGFALARKLLIVPLRIGTDPYGFIGKFQAIQIPDQTTPYPVAHSVFDALARNPLTATRMAAPMVRRFANSDSYDNTRDAFPLLEGISAGSWTDQMIEEVERATVNNTQVKDASLPGGRRAADAAEELVAKVREETGRIAVTEEDFVPGSSGDDDIPF